MRYIAHITLATGGIRQSWRHEVDPDVIREVQTWLQGAIAADGVPVKLPGDLDDYKAIAVTEAGTLTVIVLRGQTALATFAVATRSRHARQLWKHMTETASFIRRGIREPEAPWLAVDIKRALLSDPEASQWLPDFERCVAWAWIDRGECA